MNTNEIRKALLLYAVTDPVWARDGSQLGVVREALEGGVTMLQLRDKHADTASLARQAKEILPLCREYGVPLIIDDDPEAVMFSGADGVHVGQSDTDAIKAREIIGADKILGVSAQTEEQALRAQAAGADYLGVGAVFPTSTKLDADDVPPEKLKKICAVCGIPVVAIGGINVYNISMLRATGVAGIAVVSALFGAADVRAAARELYSGIRGII